MLALAAALLAQASTAIPPTPYARAVAAGYKAAMYCSGVFNAGRSQAEIDRDELTGIYPEYDAILPTLKATVDPTGTGPAVSVPFDLSLPPRYAVWRRGQGCTTLPIGTAGTTAEAWAHKHRNPSFPDQLSAGQRDTRLWPMGDAGIHPRLSRALAQAVAKTFDGHSYGEGKTVGVVVLRDGRVRAERYAAQWSPWTSNRTWSVAKSIAGTLVGQNKAVIAEANLSGPGPSPDALDAPTPALPQWSAPGEPRASIRLDDLLRMASGLHTDTAGNRTDAIYFGGTTVDEQVFAWPLEAPPGTRFRYSNTDILLAVAAMRGALGESAYSAMPSRLFAALGMMHTVAEQDWHGNYILSSQVWSTARDLARLGQFWLQDGVWQGRRLLPEGWIKYMTTPSGPQPADGPGYGATLWLFGPKQGLRAGTYAAQGNRGQYIMVVPSERLVVVRRGEDPGVARFDIARFTADVIAATHTGG